MSLYSPSAIIWAMPDLAHDVLAAVTLLTVLAVFVAMIWAGRVH